MLNGSMQGYDGHVDEVIVTKHQIVETNRKMIAELKQINRQLKDRG